MFVANSKGIAYRVLFKFGKLKAKQNKTKQNKTIQNKNDNATDYALIKPIVKMLVEKKRE